MENVASFVVETATAHIVPPWGRCQSKELFVEPGPGPWWVRQSLGQEGFMEYLKSTLAGPGSNKTCCHR